MSDDLNEVDNAIDLSGDDVDLPDTEETTEPESEVAESEEISVTIGDDEPEDEVEKAPQWVKDLRKENRELKKQLRTQAPQSQEVALPKKPSLSDDDIDYDPEKFEQALESWYEVKKQHDAKIQAEEAEKNKVQQTYQEKYNAYLREKESLGVKHFDEAEQVVLDTLNQIQQSIVVKHAKNSALVVYALGKNPKYAKELADIKDPIEFAIRMKEIEEKLNVSKRGKTPEPETRVSGNRGTVSAITGTLKALEEEAMRTGDRSKVIAYKRANKK